MAESYQESIAFNQVRHGHAEQKKQLERANLKLQPCSVLLT
jgi:hypothetical protein